MEINIYYDERPEGIPFCPISMGRKDERSMGKRSERDCRLKGAAKEFALYGE